MSRGTLAALGVAAAAALVYAPALGNGFVWDDPLILTHQLPLIGGVRGAFFPPRDLPLVGSFYYRPVVWLTYLADDALGGGGPLAFHATPVVVHAAVCALLCLLFQRLLGPGALGAATLGALLFAVHPVNAEVAAWMAGRAESLAALGVVAALLAWGAFLAGGRRRWLAGGGAALFLGLLGKETALAGAPLAAALPWVWPAARAPDARARRALWATVAAAVAAYVALRAAAHGLRPGAARAVPAADVGRAVLGALGYYAEALVWPRTPGAVLTAAPTDAGHLAAGALAFAAGALGLAAAVRRRAPLPAWALGWVIAALALPLLLVVRFISETPVAERYLYLPSAGAALYLAWAMARVPPRRWRPAVAGVAVVLAGAAAVTAGRTRIWHDEAAFWRHAARVAPDEGVAHLKLAVTLVAARDLPAAEAAYRAALGARLSPEQRALAANSLAQLLLMRGAADEAEPLVRGVLAGAGGESRTRATYLMGHVHLVRGDPAGARRWFREVIATDPGSDLASEARAALARLGEP